MPNANTPGLIHFAMRLTATLVLTLGLVTAATAQSDCESRCMDDYGRTRYPSDQNLCMRSSAPGRCLDETRANARNYCRERCNANWQGAAEKPAPTLNLDRIQPPKYDNPKPRPPTAVTGDRG